MEKSETQQSAEVLKPTTTGDKIKHLLPEYMAELTQQFESKKALAERAKIRLKMKAVLDILSVDTEYPSIEKKETKEADVSPRRYDGGRLVDAPDSRLNETILGGT